MMNKHRCKRCGVEITGDWWTLDICPSCKADREDVNLEDPATARDILRRTGFDYGGGG